MKIVIVGEAWGEAEEREGKPFVGTSGRLLDGMLSEVGIKREDCYVTNVINRRPAGNDFSCFTKEEVEEGTRQLQEHIKAQNPNVVLCLGSQALKAVSGRIGIADWRGSVLCGWGGYKVIGTYHPAAILREWRLRIQSIHDLHRVVEESGFAEVRTTPREYLIAYKYEDALAALESLKGAKYVAFDIETESSQITCISFAIDSRPNWAVSIPFWFASSGSLFPEAQEISLWDKIRDILTDDGIGKIAHNGSYDIEFIWRTMGFRVRGFALDTMLMAHALYLELPKSLAFWVSMYTDHPYYKHQISSSSMDEFFRYNATDSCLTMEIALKMESDLKQEELWEFYLEYVHSLVEPLLDMQLRGVKFDYLRRNSVKKRFQEEVAVLQRNLDAAVGHPLNVNSPKQMKEWLYGELKLKERTKKRKATGETTISADDEALQALYKESGNPALQTVLRIREKQKILSTYLEVKLDDDKRIRCQYNITGTETGRLSSGKTTRSTGTNLQNVPPGIVRSLFVPDDGHIFINADLSQAEARVVAYLANEPRLIRVFEEGGDIHRKNAANIFKCAEGDVPDNLRQLAKRVVHACVDGDTELLSRSHGWVKIKDLGEGEVAVWFPDGSIKFEKPKRKFVYDYDGKMYEMSGVSLQALCTPNHQWPVRSYDSIYKREYVVKRRTDQLPRHGRIPSVGMFEPFADGWSNAHVQLMVATQADGSIHAEGQVTFHFAKARKDKRLQGLLDGLGLKYTRKVRHGEFFYYIPRQSAQVLTRHLLPGKTFSLDFLLAGDVYNRKTFIEEVTFWDGERNSKAGRQTSYFSTNLANAEIVQTIAHLTGKQAVLRKAPLRNGCKQLYLVSFNRRKYVRILNLKMRKVAYAGKKVYCIETSSGYFVYRKKHTIGITSNSNYGMGPITFAKTAGIEVGDARKLLNQYFATYPGIANWQLAVKAQLQKNRCLVTPFGRKRYFYNRWGDELGKEGFAFIPQSVVADIMGSALVCMHKAGVELLLQVHDSVLVQCEVARVGEVTDIIKRCMTRPLTIDGRTLVIPVDVKVGYDWDKLEKWV